MNTLARERRKKPGISKDGVEEAVPKDPRHVSASEGNVNVSFRSKWNVDSNTVKLEKAY